ncbi:hypothetical protein X801_01038 [Opisthorchis viverrini]|uniref:Uncharacterized protein n=1 Tax=Opisthorchis viverrini TaxID=6198 RepID=A0A1S8X8I3_OPIVI|nr:hypothetical protein X801_01038 [Opisthorchis viverrini]
MSVYTKPGHLDYTNVCENHASGPLLAATDIRWQLPSGQSHLFVVHDLLRHPAVSRDTTINGHKMRTLICNYVLITCMLSDQEAVSINGTIQNSTNIDRGHLPTTR